MIGRSRRSAASRVAEQHRVGPQVGRRLLVVTLRDRRARGKQRVVALERELDRPIERNAHGWRLRGRLHGRLRRDRHGSGHGSHTKRRSQPLSPCGELPVHRLSLLTRSRTRERVQRIQLPDVERPEWVKFSDSSSRALLARREADLEAADGRCAGGNLEREQLDNGRAGRRRAKRGLENTVSPVDRRSTHDHC